MPERSQSSDADPSLGLRAVLLVEGASDQRALTLLARRHNRDLRADAVAVVAMRGATNIGRFLTRYGPQGRNIRIGGLYDVAEEAAIRRACASAGIGRPRTRADLEDLRFFACVTDLEDELIRSLGAASVEQVIDAEGELGLFRTFQHQPAQRHKSVEQQLRRFLGTRSGRKIHYAGLLVEALDLARAPPPLDHALFSV